MHLLPSRTFGSLRFRLSLVFLSFIRLGRIPTCYPAPCMQPVVQLPPPPLRARALLLPLLLVPLQLRPPPQASLLAFACQQNGFRLSLHQKSVSASPEVFASPATVPAFRILGLLPFLLHSSQLTLPPFSTEHLYSSFAPGTSSAGAAAAAATAVGGAAAAAASAAGSAGAAAAAAAGEHSSQVSALWSISANGQRLCLSCRHK